LRNIDAHAGEVPRPSAKPLDPTASHAARLGVEIRERRLAAVLADQFS
jgi:hypothetical protein